MTSFLSRERLHKHRPSPTPNLYISGRCRHDFTKGLSEEMTKPRLTLSPALVNHMPSLECSRDTFRCKHEVRPSKQNSFYVVIVLGYALEPFGIQKEKQRKWLWSYFLSKQVLPLQGLILLPGWSSWVRSFYIKISVGCLHAILFCFLISRKRKRGLYQKYKPLILLS